MAEEDRRTEEVGEGRREGWRDKGKSGDGVKSVWEGGLAGANNQRGAESLMDWRCSEELKPEWRRSEDDQKWEELKTRGKAAIIRWCRQKRKRGRASAWERERESLA